MAALGADEKKKLYVLLGLAGVLALVLGVVFLGGGSAPPPPPPVPVPVAGAPAADTPPVANGEGASDPSTPADAAPPPAAGAPGPPTGPQLVASRPDPFRPIYKPVPIPPPAPAPEPPIELPSPDSVVALPPADPAFAGTPGLGALGGGGDSSRAALTGLPPVRIASVAQQPSTPRVFAPPPLAGSGTGLAERSGSRRLSGVVVGDSVRALLETTDAAGARVTRTVQPGDEVDGVRVLRVERVLESGRPIFRMFVREGGVERYIDLRRSPAPLADVVAGVDPNAGFEGGPPPP